MLAVEQDPVEARSRDALHGVVRRQARPEADLRLAGLQASLESVFRKIHQSNFAPDSFTTLAHFACSAVIHLPSESGVPARTSVPCLARRSLMSGELIALVSSEFKRETTSRGIPAGPMMPW